MRLESSPIHAVDQPDVAGDPDIDLSAIPMRDVSINWRQSYYTPQSAAPVAAVKYTSDGSSVAWITRVDLAFLTSEESEWKVNGLAYSLYYAGSREPLPKRFFLQPGQSARISIAFDLPSGQYQFIVGYGGGVYEGKSVASDAVSFDVKDEGLANSRASVSATECLYVYAGGSRCVLNLANSSQ